MRFEFVCIISLLCELLSLLDVEDDANQICSMVGTIEEWLSHQLSTRQEKKNCTGRRHNGSL